MGPVSRGECHLTGACVVSDCTQRKKFMNLAIHARLLLLPLLAVARVGLAQEPPASPQASLTVVNAVPGEKNVFVSFDDQSIWPPGFVSGQSTAAVMFAAGKKRLKIECEGYSATEAVLDLPSGANCAFVMYPGELVGEGPDKGKRKIGVFLPAPHLGGAKKPPAGKVWKIVLVGSKEARELEVNGKKLTLSPRKSLEFASPDGSAAVKFKGKDILGAAPEESGEYWVVVYPSGDALEAVLLNHSSFTVPSA